MSLKLSTATYALAGTGTIQERLIEAWHEAFARIAKRDIPKDLSGLYEEIDSEFKRVSKAYASETMPQCLLHLTDAEAVAVAETIVLLAFEFAKLQGMKNAQK